MDEKKVRIYHRLFFAILILSFLLRAILVISGGQNFWPDETRYEKSLEAVAALWDGNLYNAERALHRADHFLYKIIGLVPATIQIIFTPNPKIPALFFSLFSVVSLWLVWCIMLRIGENERVALFAVSLLALCTTFLYYCRHILPYDTAMAFGLLSIFVGLRTPSRSFDSILCGLFSACTFLTYNGYWILAGVAMLIHTLQQPRTLEKCARRAFIAGISFAVPLIIILAVSEATGGNLLSQFIFFSRLITQGSYSEGWSLPFLYFWDSEHFLILLWAAALIYCFKELALRNRNEAMFIGLLGIIFIYSTLIIFSVFLEKFVVYGRLARQLAPFCSILAAIFLERLWSSTPKGKYMVSVILVIAVFQAVVNFRQPFMQVFPEDFRKLAFKACVPTRSEMHFAVLIYPKEVYYPSCDVFVHPPGEYDFPYAHAAHPEYLFAKEGGKIIIKKPHPLQFLPYQYEGYTPEQRSKLRLTDISMRLILKVKK
jgi:hypothetical protein